VIGGNAVTVMSAKSVNFTAAKNILLAAFAFSSISVVLALILSNVRTWSVNIFQICFGAWCARFGSARTPRKLSSISDGILLAVVNGDNFARNP